MGVWGGGVGGGGGGVGGGGGGAHLAARQARKPGLELARQPVRMPGVLQRERC